MRGVSILGLALILRAYVATAAKIKVKEIGDNFDIHGDEVTWPDRPFMGRLTCADENTVLSLSACKKYGTCCPPGNSLKGSPSTEWHCCAEGHDVTGSKDVGYECCVKGSIFDGTLCKRPDPPVPECPNGKKLVNGRCQCPPGQEEAADGTCKPLKCESGVETGM